MWATILLSNQSHHVCCFLF